MTARYYFAITNACNRSCEFCSCHSGPARKTFLDFELYKEILPEEGGFEVQLEGGEPLLHPHLDDMIFHAQGTGRCERIVLGTNGVLLPYKYADGKLDAESSIQAIHDHFRRYSDPFVLKPSINYSLIERDPLLLDKAGVIRDAFEGLEGYELIFNVRRRRQPRSMDDDQWLVDELEKRGLEGNIFFLQRYGSADGWDELDLPFIIKNPVEFHLIDPSGKDWGTDLIARSEGMKDMG